MKPDLLIIDLDGTLVDTAEDIAESLQQVYRERDREVPDRDTIVSAIGSGVRKLIERTTPPPHDGLLEHFLSLYDTHCLRKSKLYPGVAETLEILPGKKVVLSNKPEGLCRKILTGLGIAGHFAEIFGGDSFPVRKPDPGVIRNLLEKLPAHSPLLVGDSAVDLQTARNAEIPVVAVTYGYHRQGDLDSASLRIDRFADLKNHVGSSP